MKKRKRQPNNPQPPQRVEQAESEAAARKRQEEDFARQLAAMFRAELGNEQPDGKAGAEKPVSMKKLRISKSVRRSK